MKRRYLAVLLAVTAFFAGCSLIPGAGFVPGSTTQGAVRDSLGAPVKTYSGPDGGVTWAYPTGPMGEQTWMARFDGKGTLLKFEQVLDQEHFWSIRNGMDGAQVGAILGPPSKEERFDRLHQLTWDYRYQDDWGYVSEYSIIFGEEGSVTGTFNKRLYPGRGRD